MAPWNKGTETTPDNPGPSKVMRWVSEHRDYRGKECLVWPFSRDGKGGGYGHTKRAGKNIKIHRLMCELAHGAPPTPQHQASHSCGNGHGGCVNPQHLSWKTPSENGKESATHPRHKLTPDQVSRIRRLNERPEDIASLYGVNVRTIRRILAGETWKTNGYSYGGFSVRPYRGGRPKVAFRADTPTPDERGGG